MPRPRLTYLNLILTVIAVLLLVIAAQLPFRLDLASPAQAKNEQQERYLNQIGSGAETAAATREVAQANREIARELGAIAKAIESVSKSIGKAASSTRTQQLPFQPD